MDTITTVAKAENVAIFTLCWSDEDIKDLKMLGDETFIHLVTLGRISFDAGYEIGYDEGREEGYESGYDEGYSVAEDAVLEAQ